MKDILLTILRNKHTSLVEFRSATERLGAVLACECAPLLKRIEQHIETPHALFPGQIFKHQVVLIPILRSGLALLPAFLHFYQEAKIGFIGMYRNEQTAEAHCYYENIPTISENETVILLEPMLATGGSAYLAIERLLARGIKQDQIILVSVLGATEGVAKIKAMAPQIQLVLAQYDSQLTDNKFIMPGLGDFGDRFFGTT